MPRTRSPFQTDAEAEAERRLYEAIGRLAVTFERVMAGLRSALVLMLERSGLKKQPLAHLLVAREGARGLVEVVGSAYLEFRPKDVAGHKALEPVLKRLSALVNERNEIIHSEWIFDEPSPAASAYSISFRRHKTGLTLRQLRRSARQFEELADEALELQVLVTRLGISINQPRYELADQLREPT